MRLLTAVILTSIAALPLPAAPPKNGEWKPIPELTDEFEGEGLDAKKWHDHNPTWKGRQPGFFHSKNVSVKDGKLHLTAKKEDLPNLPKGYHTFTTAAVKSKTKVLYGYFEVKCKPMNSCASSAFWFYESEPEIWTEIDVFEIGGAHPKHKRVYHMNAHVFRTPEYKGTVRKHMANPRKWNTPYDLVSGYHVYALEWDKKKIKWYVDGTVVATLENKYWHQPLYMNFDSETMPKWFGLPKKENLPSTFSVEYVRSWKKADTSKEKTK